MKEHGNDQANLELRELYFADIGSLELEATVIESGFDPFSIITISSWQNKFQQEKHYIILPESPT